MQQPPYHELTTQPTADPMASNNLSPMAAPIRAKDHTRPVN